MARFGVEEYPAKAEFMLGHGEILFWHNFLVLHSRRAFQDAAGQKRLLLRLWLHVPAGSTARSGLPSRSSQGLPARGIAEPA